MAGVVGCHAGFDCGGLGFCGVCRGLFVFWV